MAKRKRDPFAKREAQKYENPIPSREFILEYLADSNRMMTYQELVEALHMEDEDNKEALRRRLRAMQRDGQIMKGRRGRYGLVDKMDLICGWVDAHRDGFGFLQPEDHGESSFISAYQMRALFHGDKVLARLTSPDERGRQEAQIVEIVERNTRRIAGRLKMESGVAHVKPDDKRLSSHLIIPHDELNDAKDGQIVMAEITRFPTLKSQGVGRIIEVLGEHMAPGMEIDLAIRAHGLPHVWPQDTLDEANAYASDVSADDKKGRKDLTHLAFITIDGEDARDFDDAVYAETDPKGGFTLYVAIADASHYVKAGGALDREALIRGNSVYFPGNVIPMLPENLSNGLCSLNPNVDRLTLVCQMRIDASGVVKQYRFLEAVIHSHYRFTYNIVTSLLENPKNATAEQKPFLPLITTLQAMQKKMLKLRKKNGAMTFESTETKIVFGKGKKIKEIIPVTQGESNFIIESCMLAANICAARFMRDKKVPGIYRVHNPPNEDSVKTLRETIEKLGLHFSGGKKPQPKDYAHLLKSAQNRPDKQMINMLVLRSLNQAIYDIDLGEGHFGLAFDAYTHFTSPIRRYPDLLVHRIIRALIRKDKQALLSEKDLQEAASHCSTTERRADDATRDAVEWLKCEFMLDKVGQNFSGVITGVASFGFFVQLDAVYVEGLVHVSSLDNDYYHFDPDTLTLVGRAGGICYALGDKVDIKVARVDLDDRHIDFVLEGASVQPAGRRKKPVAKKKKDFNKSAKKKGLVSRKKKTSRKKMANKKFAKRKVKRGK